MRIGYLLLLLVLTGCSTSFNRSLTQSSYVSQNLNMYFKQWKGTPYAYGGSSKKGIDCSGFVQKVFSDRFDLSLPRTTTQQAMVGKKIAKRDLRAGDLIFFKTGRTNGLHVGIYDKENTFIHASTSKGVTRSSLNNHYWKKHYWQARRL